MPIMGSDQLAAILNKAILENAIYGLSAIKTAERGTDGVDTTPMRGTDNALLASSYTTERGTDGAALASIWSASRGVKLDDIESRITAARAAKLDRDLAEKGDIPTERGTDGAALASVWTAALAAKIPQFTSYERTGMIAAGSFFIPPEKTIITGAHVTADEKIELYFGTSLRAKPQTGTRGIIGAIYCDGTFVKFKNSDAASQDMPMEGVTMI